MTDEEKVVSAMRKIKAMKAFAFTLLKLDIGDTLFYRKVFARYEVQAEQLHNLWHDIQSSKKFMDG